MTQSVKNPTSAQVTILQLVGLSHASGSVLTAQSLETASNSVSPSLPLPALHSVSIFLSKNEKTLKLKKRIRVHLESIWNMEEGEKDTNMRNAVRMGQRLNCLFLLSLLISSSRQVGIWLRISTIKKL